MFSIEFLHTIRQEELAIFEKRLDREYRILEIGGGTGYQARALTDSGFDVVSIDLPRSTYSETREFPVIDYDGKHLPFRENSFDVILSSNVLEHVADLPSLHEECRRVLKPGGFCLHAMPSGSWRFWTNVANYIEFVQRIGYLTLQTIPRRASRSELGKVVRFFPELAKIVYQYGIPPRHGETGNSLSEIWTFSRSHWSRHLLQSGYRIQEASGMGLFYTGHMILGSYWSILWRRRASRLLGSACNIFKLTFTGSQTSPRDAISLP